MRRTMLIAVLAVGASCSEPLCAFGRGEREDREVSARMAYLIEMLASKNTAPVVHGNARQGGDETIRFTNGYDKALQVPVYLAAQQLLTEGEAALDALLAHVGDARYSFSLNFSNTDFNVSVSEACERIAERIVLAFKPRLHVLTRSQFGIYPKLEGVNQPLAKWWEKNKHRGLRTLCNKNRHRFLCFERSQPEPNDVFDRPCRADLRAFRRM